MQGPSVGRLADHAWPGQSTLRPDYPFCAHKGGSVWDYVATGQVSGDMTAAMYQRPLPRDVKMALDLLRGDLAHRWAAGDLARRCGVKRRTLEKHFRRFAGCPPLVFLRAERLDEARRRLLSAPPRASVTEIAAACGLNHGGRFAVVYRNRYGESPP